ncbi:MAG: phosphoglucomutase/phosphomannomutase family protein, partial [Bacteroidetes bacterium]|nr:phosphoglucomutase/phosphomannomutase family protein [Bacteroidota bacterium]
MQERDPMPAKHSDIRFGTDGWRAIIGKDFTFENVGRLAHATASWLDKEFGHGACVALGHDTRFQARAFSEFAARVLASRGVRVLFAEGYTPTPALSWATKEYACNAGVVITASHNPPEYNGFKLKGDFGGSALPEMVSGVEREIPDSTSGFDEPASFGALLQSGAIELRPVRSEYLEMLRGKLDIDTIRKAGLRLVHDAMYGAGAGMFTELIGPDSVIELHSEINPGFGGRSPEPIERNLPELQEIVVSRSCSAGIATDGDADRIGMFDEKGRFVDSHRLLTLLVRYLHEDKKLSGHIVKTVSTTDMLDAMGRAYGLHVHTTPIGFKFIVDYMLENDVLVGGEESGGMAVKGHILERDGIYIGLLILEMMARRGKYLSALVNEIFDDFGPHAYHRVDVHTTELAKLRALRFLSEECG